MPSFKNQSRQHCASHADRPNSRPAGLMQGQVTTLSAVLGCQRPGKMAAFFQLVVGQGRRWSGPGLDRVADPCEVVVRAGRSARAQHSDGTKRPGFGSVFYAGAGLRSLSAGGLDFDRSRVVEGLMESLVVPPVDPVHGRELDLGDRGPGRSSMDEFGLVEAVDCLRESVVVAVATRADGQVPGRGVAILR